MPPRRNGVYSREFKPPKEAGKAAYYRWRHSCLKKVQFESQEAVERDHSRVAYKCPFCPYWHAASAETRRKREDTETNG